MSARSIVVAGKKLGRHTDEAWLRGRQKGFEAGVKSEREDVLKALAVEIKEWKSLGMKDEADALRMLEEMIQKGLHAIPGKISR